MSRPSLNIALDSLLLLLYIGVVLTPLPEMFGGVPIHMALSLLLAGAFTAHLILHQRWIANAFRRFRQLPSTTRIDFIIGLGLFVLYGCCLLSGLLAKLFFFINFGLHLLIQFIHILIALQAVALQGYHLFRHRKWIGVQLKRLTPSFVND